MNKRGQAGVELQSYYIIELVLGILIVGILLSLAMNPDSYSNINHFYLQEDLSLLSETLSASPGYIEYDYKIKSTYEVEIDDSTVSVIKNPKLKNYFNNYTLHFESKNGDLTYENQ
ncbi:hypothetical protein HN840_05305 [archaeon]|nr:hypothetical protein [archaeon]MBT3730964.1 hypothetical protein [archaeon]MBT4669798.1 hypothetical protein [archaeon]MBT7053387.1 hypothetical protein [archaeon]MBT7281712.1 hypothetical protein [archaeon]